MKLLNLITYSCLLFSTISGAAAALPPQYLYVPHWKICLGTITKGNRQFLCFPENKPDNCPDSSWRKLNKLKELENCPK